MLGWPVLVKASAGGGGRGMRIVHQGDDLVAAVESARREATAAFGDGTVFLEPWPDAMPLPDASLFDTGVAPPTCTATNAFHIVFSPMYSALASSSPAKAVLANQNACSIWSSAGTVSLPTTS